MRINKKRHMLAFWLQVVGLEGIVAGPLVFAISSMEKNAVIMGYSVPRFILGVLFTIFGIAIFAVGQLLRMKRLPARPWIEDVSDFLAKGDRHFYATALLSFLSISGALLLAYMRSTMVPETSILRVVLIRTQSIFLWLIAVCLQTIWLIHLAFPEARHFKPYVSQRTVRIAGFSSLIILAAVLQGVIHGYKIDLFSWLPNWYWGFSSKQVRNPTILPTLVLLVPLALWLTRHPRIPTLLGITILLALGYVLQLSYWFMIGPGFEALMDFYLRRGRSFYHLAVSHPFFRWGHAFQMEEVFSGDIAYFTRTKPPGYVLFYALVGKLFTPNYMQGTLEGNASSLVVQITRAFPLLATMAVPLVVLYARRVFESARQAIAAGGLYFMFPGTILFGLQLDQVLFPSLFLVGILLWDEALRDRPGFALLVGLHCYLCLFVSFSLTALAFYLGSMLLVRFLQSRHQWSWRRILKLTFLAVSGFLIGHIGSVVALDYDFLSALRGSLAHHDLARDGILFNPPYFSTLLVNSLELIMWLCLPTLILLTRQAIESTRASLMSSPGKIDEVFWATAATVLCLLFFGSTNAEVARLWLFLIAPISILVANQLQRIFSYNPLGMHLFSSAQLIATFLIFKNQFRFM